MVFSSCVSTTGLGTSPRNLGVNSFTIGCALIAECASRTEAGLRVKVFFSLLELTWLFTRDSSTNGYRSAALCPRAIAVENDGSLAIEVAATLSICAAKASGKLGRAAGLDTAPSTNERT